MAGVFHRHDFSFKWSDAEIAPAITGFGYDWVFRETGRSLGEIMQLLGDSLDATLPFADPVQPLKSPSSTNPQMLSRW